MTLTMSVYELAQGYLEALQERRSGAYLQRHPEALEVRSSSGETLLHLLVVQNELPAVQLLAALGAEVDCRNEAGFTPLADAVGLGYGEMVELLLELGADVRCRSDFGETVIHRWVNSPEPQVLKALVQAGADLNARCDMGQTPLLSAIASHAMSNPELVQKLLPTELDAKMLNSQRRLQSLVGDSPALGAVEQLVRAGASLKTDANQDSPLQRAKEYGDQPMVDLLQRLGA